MIKITFLGAGSTVFAKNVLGDTMLTDALKKCEIALYDIDSERLEESYIVIEALNKTNTLVAYVEQDNAPASGDSLNEMKKSIEGLKKKGWVK